MFLTAPRWCLLAVVLTTMLPLRTAAAAPFRIVAITGQDAPGTGANPADFLSFSDLAGDEGPVINNQGQVAFSARLALRSVTVNGAVVSDLNDRGIWSESGAGALGLVAREGMAAPGLGADVFGHYLREPVLNDGGRVAFAANLNRDIEFRSVWTNAFGGLNLLARTGDDAPPGADMSVDFLGFDNPVFNNASRAAFRGTLTGNVDPTAGVNDRGLWRQRDEDGVLRLVTRAGNLAPLQPVVIGDTANFTEFSPPVFNDFGVLAFRGMLVGGTVTAANARGIWTESPSGLVRPIAREGTIAAGANQLFGPMGLPEINSQGQVAFEARLVGGGAGIWRTENGALSLIARTGSPVVNVANTLLFAGFGHPVMNNRGRIAFAADLAGPSVVAGVNDHAIVMTLEDGFRVVARTGEQAPGMPPGVTFARCGNVDFEPTMNLRGQVAFMACLATPDAAQVFSKGIFALDERGDLQLVARTGATIELAPEHSYVVTNLKFRAGSGGGDGLGRSFNNASRLVYWAELAPVGAAGTVETVIDTSVISSYGLGDINGDGVVDRWDLALMSEWWGSEDFWEGDFDLDGKITVADLSILQQNFGQEFPDGSRSPAPIPEPGTFVLALAGMLALSLRGRRTARFSDAS